MRHLEDIINPVTGNSYQVVGQQKYIDTIIIILLYAGKEPHVTG